MRCSTCQMANPDTAEYCQSCGTKLVKVCPNCGNSNPLTYVFCGECGHNLAKAKEPTVEGIRQQPMPKAHAQEAVVAATAPEPVSAAAPQPAPAVKWEAAPQPTPVVKWEVASSYDRVPTGIQGLDPLIEGGFLANKVYLVSGEAGTGKTIFGLQFIFNGLILGESGVYATGDEKANHIFDDARSLGWDLAKYVEAKKLVLMDVSSSFADLRAGRTKHIDTRALVGDLTKQVKAVGAKRIVIDPVAPLVFGDQSSVFVQEYIRNLILEVEDNLRCTTLVTSDIMAGTPGISRYGVEEFVTEGVVVLGMSKQSGQRVRTLSVRKMRSTAVDIQDHVFEIVPHRGIVLG